MKKIGLFIDGIPDLGIVLGTWLICAMVGIGLGAAGCTATQQTTTYKTIYGLESTATAAMDAYLAGVVKGTFRTNDVPKVSKAFNQFQKDATVFLDAAQFSTNPLAPASLVQEASDITAAILTAEGTK